MTVSGKDRSAIMLGGQLADAAYWIVDTLFVTSSYYRPDLPAVGPGLQRGRGRSAGTSDAPGSGCSRAEAYQVMGPDAEPAERDVAGMGRTFPHRSPE